MPRRYVMAISCICHYRLAHKLVTAHLECRALLRVCPLYSLPSLSLSLPPFSSSRNPSLSAQLSLFLSVSLPFVYYLFGRPLSLSFFFPFLLLPSKCLPLPAGVVCIMVAKRRSLSSLINVDPLLIYRRVALKMNRRSLSFSPSERTTLGIPVAR